MMKKIIYIIMCYLCIVSQAQALLSPLHQSIAELDALVDLLHNSAFASGEIIQKIERTESGYTITTNKKELEVDLVYKKNGRLGPAVFEFIMPN